MILLLEQQRQNGHVREAYVGARADTLKSTACECILEVLRVNLPVYSYEVCSPAHVENRFDVDLIPTPPHAAGMNSSAH